MSRTGRHDERGAVAILFALLATVLFAVGALAVDIGHAYAKRSLEQTDVDVAVMAAAAELTSGGACNQAVIDTATEYLSKPENAVPQQYPINLGGTPGDQDGYIHCDHWRVDLWAPSSRVDFSLAGAIPGAPSGIDVDAYAAAQIKAAGNVLPYFAVDGCDSDIQILRDDSGKDGTGCDDSHQGNFGTLDLPRSDTTSSQFEWNVIRGIQPTLAPHPNPLIAPCDGAPGSVVSKSTPVNGTNCVFTLTGLKMAQTNRGLVEGDSPYPGRLDADTTGNCSRGSDNQRTAKSLKGIKLNDDVLTCFITNGAHISDLVAGNSVGEHALSGDIFKSPRFFWLPVFKTDPMKGKKAWPILRFRPGFITGQAVGATRTAPGDVGDFNGLVVDSSGIQEVHVVLFSENALPITAAAVGGEGDYAGYGPKVIVLVE